MSLKKTNKQVMPPERPGWFEFQLSVFFSAIRPETQIACNISSARNPSRTWNTRNTLITVLEFFSSGPLKAWIRTRRQYTPARVQRTGGKTNTRCRNMLKVSPPSAVAKSGLCSGKMFSSAVASRANISRVPYQLIHEGQREKWIWDRRGNLQPRKCEI